MKTQFESSVRKIRISELIMYVVFIVITLVFSRCSQDEEVKGPDTRSLFIGSYAVEDVSASSGYVYNYDLTISNGSDGELNISNFADLFNVPVKATVNGSKLTIKSQSFTNPSGKQIQVSGSGTITSDVLNFTYTTTGYLDYTGTCTANKKQ